jgi:hypothetical protein
MGSGVRFRDVRGGALLLVLLPAFLAGCAMRGTPVPVAATAGFDCDAPPGKFADWNRPLQGLEVSFSGTLELLEPHRDPSWASAATILLAGTESAVGDSLRVGLRAVVDWNAPELIHVLSLGPDEPVQGRALLVKGWHGAALPFTLSLSRSGRLVLAVAGNTRVLQLGTFAAERVSLTCSAGRFRFTAMSMHTGS